MNKTNIEWCTRTWNPVTGCTNDCPYCFARIIAHRFDAKGKGIISCDGVDPGAFHSGLFEKPFPYGFEPTFYVDRLDEPKKERTPQDIFVVDMGDLFGPGVPEWAIYKVYDACKLAPWHRYLFCTKYPEGIHRIHNGIGWPYEWPEHMRKNIWYGTTITCNNDLHRIGSLPLAYNRFLSIEPLSGPIDFDERPYKIAVPFADWVIIGMETGKRREKVIPKAEWVQKMAGYCKALNIPVFMKNNLAQVMGAENLIQEKPW